jgi:hypothetical protein
MELTRVRRAAAPDSIQRVTLTGQQPLGIFGNEQIMEVFNDREQIHHRLPK